MAELHNDDVLKIGVLSVSEFAKKNAGGVSSQAISYAMDHDKLDYTWMGDERFVVLTEKSLAYKPNFSSRRKKAA